MINLKGKSFLKLLDLTSEEIHYLLDLSSDLKAKKKNGIPHRLCEGKNIVLLFEKTRPAEKACVKSPLVSSFVGRFSSERNKK